MRLNPTVLSALLRKAKQQKKAQQTLLLKAQPVLMQEKLCLIMLLKTDLNCL